MNLTPFEKPTSIDCGAFHMIVGAMPKVWNQEIEAERLMQIVDNESVREFLPDLSFSNTEEAEEWLIKLPVNGMIKRNLPIILRLNEPLATIGYMMCYSPLTFDENNEDGYKGWAIEYFLDKQFWSQGIMSAALQNILSHLQKLGVQTIRASTHRNNIASIRVLEKLRLRRMGSDNKVGDHIVYQVELN